jgi:hypothetical protein
MRIRFTYRGPFDSEATTGDLADQSPATGYGCAKSAECQHNWSLHSNQHSTHYHPKIGSNNDQPPQHFEHR